MSFSSKLNCSVHVWSIALFWSNILIIGKMAGAGSGNIAKYLLQIKSFENSL